MPIDPSQTSRPQSTRAQETTPSGRFRQLPSQVGQRISDVASTAMGFVASVFSRLNSLIRWTLSLFMRGRQGTTTSSTQSDIRQPLLPHDAERSDSAGDSSLNSGASSSLRPSSSTSSLSTLNSTDTSNVASSSSSGVASSSSSNFSGVEDFEIVHTESSLRRDFEQWLPRHWQTDETFGRLQDPIVQLGIDLSRSAVKIGDSSLHSLEDFHTALQTTPFAARAGIVAELLCQAVMGPVQNDLTIQVMEKLNHMDSASNWMPAFEQKYGNLQVQLNPPATSDDPWTVTAEIHFEPKAVGLRETVLLTSRIAVRTEVALPSSLADLPEWNLRMAHSVQLVQSPVKVSDV